MTEEQIAAQAVAIVLHRQLVEHEAAHAAAALLLDGIDVVRVTAPFIGLAEGQKAAADSPDAAAGVTHVEADGHRAMLLATLCGPLACGEAYWPPKYPPSLAPITPDEKLVGEQVKALDMDGDEYARTCDAARELVASPVFTTLHKSICTALAEPPHTLTEDTLRHHLHDALEANMQTKTTTSTATALDAGEFTAIISSAAVDREGDRVDPQAMVSALKAWAAVGKQVPLVWQHDSTNPEEAIGTVDPASASVVGSEVRVAGHIDQTTPRGEQAWRLVKTRSLGFSFGYLIPEGGASPNAYGGRDIHRLDIFEITATLTPMNADTRVTGWKSAGLTGIEASAGFAEGRALALAACGATTAPADTSPAAEREKALAVAERVVSEVGPITIARFSCD